MTEQINGIQLSDQLWDVTPKTGMMDRYLCEEDFPLKPIPPISGMPDVPCAFRRNPEWENAVWHARLIHNIITEETYPVVINTALLKEELQENKCQPRT